MNNGSYRILKPFLGFLFKEFIPTTKDDLLF
jgi:hypothetical protein